MSNIGNMDFRNKATEALSFIERRTRTPSGEEYYCCNDERPQWLQDIIREAHDNGNMLPDDWRYKLVYRSLQLLEESEDWEDLEYPEEIYTSELTSWLASHNARYSYCDEALDEYGRDLTGINDPTLYILQIGYIQEFREVCNSIASSLEKLVEAEGEEE